jgi:hypothetical protein
MFLDKKLLDPPKVFISSTVLDESGTYRKNITGALTNMGIHIIEFQDNHFPYGNDNSTNVISETIEAVHTADVFLMLVGKKYGHIHEDGKSVIHHEYEEALKYNLTIFVFIEDKVWSDYNRNLIGGENYIENEKHRDFIKQVSINKILNFGNDNQCVEHIKAQFNNHLGGLFRFSRQATWLWGEYKTRGIESNAKEIWIITPDFYWDFSDVDFRNIVVNNIIRGCVYRYIYLDNEINKRNVEEMVRSYKLLFKKEGIDEDLVSKRAYFLAIKEDDFVWSSEQILFNPFSLEENAIMVDIMDVKDKSLKYNIAYGHQKQVTFRGQFMSIWNKHTEKEPDKINTDNYRV